MKVICIGALTNEATKLCKKNCMCHEPHKPHEHDDKPGILKCAYSIFDINSKCKCACVPIGLEYYMREIIKKHEESKE